MNIGIVMKGPIPTMLATLSAIAWERFRVRVIAGCGNKSSRSMTGMESRAKKQRGWQKRLEWILSGLTVDVVVK